MLQPNLTLTLHTCLSLKGMGTVSHYHLRAKIIYSPVNSPSSFDPPRQTCSSPYLLHLRIRLQLFTNLGVFFEAYFPSPLPPVLSVLCSKYSPSSLLYPHHCGPGAIISYPRHPNYCPLLAPFQYKLPSAARGVHLLHESLGVTSLHRPF